MKKAVTTQVRVQNGGILTATYRNDNSKRAFVRVNGLTVSGYVEFNTMDSYDRFIAEGTNAALVQ